MLRVGAQLKMEKARGHRLLLFGKEPQNMEVCCLVLFVPVNLKPRALCIVHASQLEAQGPLHCACQCKHLFRRSTVAFWSLCIMLAPLMLVVAAVLSVDGSLSGFTLRFLHHLSWSD
jgi:hypothetical protein